MVFFTFLYKNTLVSFAQFVIIYLVGRQDGNERPDYNGGEVYRHAL
ncbi:hypothetical protein CPTAKMECS_202 [Salmonella phage vB_SenS-AKM_ECS]|uniref:Uncharacterized protein n=1 Tax=Salmonella phage vB_SenS-AKM_HA2021_32 TaxID=3158841 RepID=A0AAU7L2M6_9CAUD|nr:hypothetical protein CPTAKMECS_202 [Salmonella phage vB_SenS-AKM_ECS]